jgi:2-succinyl-5-enolpyruvyl-6-hydroxy-3-cyclohexene-1-carboxylate synthase
MLFVDELARGGLTSVCIAPGSRSTPLALAFFANDEIHVYNHLDERSAAFFALGIALAEGKPVALVCTSGTATANFHPAIIEAQMSQVPLLILTADRPPELRHSGANQTIDQVKMFGDHVLWSVDVALPQPQAPVLALRNLRTLAARALARSNGLVKGPVHLNFPFRKPLEPGDLDRWPPVMGANTGQRPYTQYERGILQPTAEQVAILTELIATHRRGLIICGPRCPAGDFPTTVAQLSATTGYPILADPLSGVRFGPQVSTTAVLGGYETFLQVPHASWPEPDLILRFGSVPTSKWLNNYLNHIDPSYHIHIQESGIWADQSHMTSHFFQVNVLNLCHQLIPAIRRPTDNKWQHHWLKIETNCWSAARESLQDIMFDGSVIAALIDQLAPDTMLFVGNSLAIRHVDQFGRPQEKPLRLFANRGASGIDGNVSTGLGIAAASNRPTVLLVGDITFYHDSNGLLALRQFGLDNATILLINNNGGGIFRRLPVAQIEPPFEELFLTPHGLDFAPLATMYGIDYHLAQDLASFRSALDKTISTNSASIIEVRTDGQEDDRVQRTIISQVKVQIETESASDQNDE